MSAVLYEAARPARTMPDYDRALLWTVLLLLAFSVVMVYSASIAIAEGGRSTGYRGHFYLVRQCAFAVIGLTAAAIAFQVPMSAWQRASPWLFGVGLLLLALVLVPGVSREINGARRWLPLGVVNFQPSELVKLFAVLYAADYTVRKAGWADSLRRGIGPMLIAMLLVGGLLILQPDYGAFFVVTLIGMGILFLGGMNWRLFAGVLALLVVGFVLLIVVSPYRMQRVVGFLDPWSDAYGKGYQLSHALIAFGRGEWFGVGLGASVEKLFYLPEAHTDFLLSVIAEELGFVGVACVIATFAWIGWRAFSIGAQAARLDRPYAALVAQGVGIWICAQALINMGVNMGVLPTKGLTLPLLSFGGSALVANCLALAVLLRVDAENRRLIKGLPA